MRINRLALKSALLGVLVAGFYAMPVYANPPKCLDCAVMQAACFKDTGKTIVCNEPLVGAIVCVGGHDHFKRACHAQGGSITDIAGIVTCQCLLD